MTYLSRCELVFAARQKSGTLQLRTVLWRWGAEEEDLLNGLVCQADEDINSQISSSLGSAGGVSGWVGASSHAITFDEIMK